MTDKSYPLVAPSILSADFSRLGEALQIVESSGAEWLHLDVMDGIFVSNLTFGPKMIRDLRPRSQLFFDTHLMIVSPENLVDEFIDAGSDCITFHWEATTHHHRLIERIRKKGKKVGISIVPSTPAHFLDEILPFLDLVLIMTVNPGFGGQSFLDFCTEKIKYLCKQREKSSLRFKISVDGGINPQTYLQARSAGADILVAGSSFFESKDPEGLVRLFKTPSKEPV